MEWHKFSSVSASVPRCSELFLPALNYWRDGSHLWGNPAGSALCPLSLRRGRWPLPELQRYLVVVSSAPCWVSGSETPPRTPTYKADDNSWVESRFFPADVLMPGGKRGLATGFWQDHSKEDSCVSKRDPRVMGTPEFKEKSPCLNSCCHLAPCHSSDADAGVLLFCGRWRAIFPHPQTWSINPENSDGCWHWALSPLLSAPHKCSYFFIHLSRCEFPTITLFCLFSHRIQFISILKMQCFKLTRWNVFHIHEVYFTNRERPQKQSLERGGPFKKKKLEGD